MKYVNPRIVKCFLENSQKSAQMIIRNVALDAKMGTRSMLAMLFCTRLKTVYRNQNIKTVMPGVHKMVKHTLKILH